MNTSAAIPPSGPAAARRALPVALAACALLAALSTFAWLRAARTPSFHGMTLDAGEPISGLTFQSEAGPVTIEQFRGKPTIFYFGYTQCPDVCPTTLSDLAKAVRSMGTAGDDVQVVMVTVDPRRDDAAHMARYVHIFDPRFVGLSGSETQVADAASRFGVHYARSDDGEAYSMEHTASLLVLDAKGRLRLILPYGMPKEQIADDLHAALSL